MSQKKKWLILSLSLICITYVLTTPLTDIGRIKGTYEYAHDNEDILDAEELSAFLTTWVNFINKDIANYSSRSISLEIAPENKGFPPQLIRWLKRQGWNSERFFDNEQKIRGLLNYAIVENNIIASNILKNKINGANMSQIISEQNEQLQTFNGNPEELALIKANFYEVNRIMSLSATVSTKP